jgi:hypothetical protein
MFRYTAYLLRVWRDEEPGARWVARLEYLEDGAKRRFEDPEALLRHLAAAVSATAETTQAADETATPPAPLADTSWPAPSS